MSALLNAFVASLTALGLILSVLGFRAWFRFAEPRLGLLFLAFLGFLAQGMLLTYALFIENQITTEIVVAATAMSGGSLLLVYLATLARPAR